MSERTHLDARAQHARRRATERYGFEFDKLALVDLRNRIIEAMIHTDSASGCIHLYQQTEVLSHWAVWYGGEWVPLVYDESMGAVVTFLPKHSLRRHKAKLPW